MNTTNKRIQLKEVNGQFFNLKTIYHAVTIEQAESALMTFAEK